MKKEKVTFNELTAGALLKFGKLDSVDMTLLMYGISSVADVVNNNYEWMDDYFIMSDGSIILNESYINKFHREINNTLLERMQGSVVKKYLDSLKIEEFVLRKIKLLGMGCVPTDDLIHTFSVSQIYAITWLYHEGLIIDYWHKENIYDDYKAIKLTKKGELYLYLIDHAKEIEKFCQLLRVNGYDELLIESFLISQNLKKDSKDILTLDNFMHFCDEYDRCPYVLKERKCGLKRAKVPGKK